MKTGLLVRVAIDSTAGNWNAPCSKDGRFCYVPQGSSKHLSKDHNYSEYQPYVEHLTKSAASLRKTCCWPSKLPKLGHFDPSFKYCTYGDGGGSQRGERIWDVLNKDKTDERFIVFYAGLRDMDTGNLTYSIIGFYWIKRIERVRDISKAHWHRNEHTDRNAHSDLPRHRPNDVVVFGDTKHEQTGRLCRHIPIGSYREGAWRVTKPLLKAWGGLCIENGFIQRNAFLPKFCDPSSFLGWFRQKRPNFKNDFIHADNIKYTAA